MASFRPGLFGGSAPRMSPIRRLQPTQDRYAPSIEELQAQTAAQMQAASSEIESAGSGGVRRLGAFMHGPEKPTQAPTQPPPRGVSTAYLPEPPAAPAMSNDDGGFLRNFGYRPDETGQNLGEWLFSGRGDVQNAKAEQANKLAAQQAHQAQQAQIQALRQAGYGEDQIIAFVNNPEKWSESLATGIQAANVEGGNSRFTGGANGKFITAPKLLNENGVLAVQGTDGYTEQGRLSPSYADDNAAAIAAETGRHNRATEGIEATKAANEASKTGLPDFSNENQLRSQYLSQAKPFQDVATAANRVNSLSATLNPPEQMALVFSVMKMLDPGSTVRETEYANAQNTTGALDKMWNYYNTLKSGNFLNEQQIKEFRALVGNQYKAAEASYSKTYDFYRGMASRYPGMSPDIIQDFRATPAAPKPNMAQQGINAIGDAVKGIGGMFMHPGGAQQPPHDVTDLLDKYK